MVVAVLGGQVFYILLIQNKMGNFEMFSQKRSTFLKRTHMPITSTYQVTGKVWTSIAQ